MSRAERLWHVAAVLATALFVALVLCSCSMAPVYTEDNGANGGMSIALPVFAAPDGCNAADPTCGTDP